MYAIRSYYAEETAAAAEELSGQANQLQSLIRQFNLNVQLSDVARKRNLGPSTGRKIVITSYSIHYTKLYDWVERASILWLESQ